MNELTPADVDRLTRELVDRFKAFRSTGDYFLDAATMGGMMAEYPAAVGFIYLLMTQSQMLAGDAVVKRVRR